MTGLATDNRAESQRRLLWLGLVFLIFLLALPAWADSHILTVGTMVLMLALMGQSWNLMLGFAGLLSIGHALFVGIGAYTAAYIFTSTGLPPILTVFPAVALAVLVGMLIGYLGFRFSIGGVYFALLTIAFAELARILTINADFLNGSQGLFIKVSEADRRGVDLINLRGVPEMYYYIMLALAGGTLWLCWRLLRSKLGYYWQAIRDDAEAAEAVGVHVFRYKMYAVMISAGIAGVAGVFYAFYQNSLFPNIIFNISLSIEYTLGPIVGGVGTLFGPIFGAFILTPLSEFLDEAIHLLQKWGVIAADAKLSGLKLLIWGLFVVVIVLFRPTGLWPWFRDTVTGRARRGRKPGAEPQEPPE